MVGIVSSDYLLASNLRRMNFNEIDYCYAGLRGVVAIVNDVLVYGKTRAVHDNNLKAALQSTREMGFKLND